MIIKHGIKQLKLEIKLLINSEELVVQKNGRVFMGK